MDEVRGSMSAKRLLAMGSITLLALGAVVVLFLAYSSGEEKASTSEKAPEPKASAPERQPADRQHASNKRAVSGFMSSGPSFASLGEMAATADLIVRGTVADVRPGQVTAEGTPDEVRDLNTVVNVDEVLKGPASEDRVVVKTLEMAYSGPQNSDWRKPGQQVLLFLSNSRETPGLYIPAMISYDQTAYVIQNSSLQATSQDPLSSRVAGLSLPQLRDQVQQAKQKVAAGELTALELPR